MFTKLVIVTLLVAITCDGKTVQKRQATVDFYDPVALGEAIAGMFRGEIPFPTIDPNNIPPSDFKCTDQQWPGYYADVSLDCQVVWQCAEGIQGYHVCPNMTVWSQEYYTCMWAPVVDCARAPNYYSNNANLYIGPDVDIWGNPVPNTIFQTFDKKK